MKTTMLDKVSYKGRCGNIGLMVAAISEALWLQP